MSKRDRNVPADWVKVPMIQHIIAHYYKVFVKCGQDGAVMSRQHWNQVSCALQDHFNVIVHESSLKREKVLFESTKFEYRICPVLTSQSYSFTIETSVSVG